MKIPAGVYWAGIILVAAAGTCWWTGKSDEQRKAEKATYQRTADSLNAIIATALGHRDTLTIKVPVERVRIVHAAARVDTVRLGFQRDTTTADSLGTALTVIATQDTLIQAQAGHIKTLTEIVATDSTVFRIFAKLRVTDSLRIRQLEKATTGWLFGLRPKLKCGPGVVAVLTPGTVKAGLGAGCFVTL